MSRWLLEYHPNRAPLGFPTFEAAFRWAWHHAPVLTIKPMVYRDR